ncbi:hypothetical protein FGO68_gene16877 [Halteria grandinella]|uniref:Uncharacterized protein n=1 Tax=Halteria grandinella TaxID=5974 RepID=A0A8J8SVF7_HALGN|nr:hypothetical protein FGO68_gene16877 [Halteria grandinella]
MKQISQILDVDTDDVADSTEDTTVLQFKDRSNRKTRVVTIDKVQDERNFELKYFSIDDQMEQMDEQQVTRKVTITFGDMKAVKALIRSMMPCIQGWNCIYKPEIVGSLEGVRAFAEEGGLNASQLKKIII